MQVAVCVCVCMLLLLAVCSSPEPTLEDTFSAFADCAGPAARDRLANKRSTMPSGLHCFIYPTVETGFYSPHTLL